MIKDSLLIRVNSLHAIPIFLLHHILNESWMTVLEITTSRVLWSFFELCRYFGIWKKHCKWITPLEPTLRVMRETS